MPRLDLFRQAVHDPAFLAQGPEALHVQENLALTAAGQREVQNYMPNAAEDHLAAIVRAPLDLQNLLTRPGEPLAIPPNPPVGQRATLQTRPKPERPRPSACWACSVLKSLRGGYV